MILKTAMNVVESVLATLDLKYTLLSKSDIKATFYVYDIWLENRKLYIDIFDNEYIITLKERYSAPCIRVTFKTQNALAIFLTRDVVYYWNIGKRICMQ